MHPQYQNIGASINGDGESGVWGMSSAVGGMTYAIFAANSIPVHEVMNRLLLLQIDFKVVLGCYKGELETAFIINERNWTAILKSGLVDDQESVLMLGPSGMDSRRPATLLYRDGREPEPVGNMRDAAEAYARAQDAWTYDPMTKRYYVCEC